MDTRLLSEVESLKSEPRNAMTQERAAYLSFPSQVDVGFTGHGNAQSVYFTGHSVSP
jgi:hypothetical protein